MMSRIATLLAILACACHGRQPQIAKEVLQSSLHEEQHEVDQPRHLQELAMLLLAFNPAKAFQLSVAGSKPTISRSYPALLDSGNRLPTQVPLMSISDESSDEISDEGMSPSTIGRRSALQAAAASGVGAASLGLLPQGASAGLFDGDKKEKLWEVIPLFSADEKTKPILFDITFDTADPNYGLIVGGQGTYIETRDGGNTWNQKNFGNVGEEEETVYRFTGVSFKDGEGWIIGKPPLLLHTRNKGQNWERIPLSPKLPGDPFTITALGPGKAEMSTSSGGVYLTENAGQNWKALVKETIDATLNRISSSGVQGASFFAGSINSITRDNNGTYLAVSQRGNFYLTYRAGSDFWIPHNRESSRRISALGFVRNDLSDGLWLTTAGGDIWKTSPGEIDTNNVDIPFNKLGVRSGGYGILDVNFSPDGKEGWACGGSGIIFRSKDGGATWGKDKSADNLPTTLYTIKFFGDTGYILGSDGYLLRYKRPKSA